MNNEPSEIAPLPALRNDRDSDVALRVQQRRYIQAATADNTRRTNRPFANLNAGADACPPTNAPSFAICSHTPNS